jgi:hypothetical protein
MAKVLVGLSMHKIKGILSVFIKANNSMGILRVWFLDLFGVFYGLNLSNGGVYVEGSLETFYGGLVDSYAIGLVSFFF